MLADAYIKDVTSGLRVSRVRLRTSAWMTSWSQQLAELTQLTTETNIQKMLEQLNETGQNNVFSAARDILKEGWRDSYSRARQYALTEAHRIHSVAHEEAIQQNPVVTQKEWRHSGEHKNTPRQNHVDMNGQRVSKDKPFTLIGRNGSFYAPMFPRDPSLPPAESVNCHCIHRAVVNPAMEKLPLEELEQMQEQFIREDDEKWFSDLDNTSKDDILFFDMYDIDDGSIQNVPLIEPSVLSARAWAKLQEAHKDLLSLVKTQPTGTEGSCVLDMDGNILQKTIGGESEVFIENQSFDYIGIHNHPSATTFSVPDIKNFARRASMKGLTAIGNNGSTVYAMFKTERYQSVAFDGAIKKLEGELCEYIEDENIFGYIDAINRFLDDGVNYGVEIIRTGNSRMSRTLKKSRAVCR